MTELSGNGLTKDLHPWQQGINEAEYLIENLSCESIDAVNTALSRLSQEPEPAKI